MKCFSKTLIATLFLTICIAALQALYVQDSVHSQITSNHKETAQIYEVNISLANSVGNVLPAERSNNSFQNAVPKVVKKTSDSLIGFIKCADKLIMSFLFQYLNFSESLLVHFRNTDIIFPFHYFW